MKVSEMTPEEFQKTFPITLEPHNPEYKNWYESEKTKILSIMREEDVVRISHIGSTSIPDLIAKPIVDILLEIDGCCNVTKLLEDMKSIGFGDELSFRHEDPFRILLAKGVSCEGFAKQVYFLHIRYAGNWNELYFRDYLIAHPETAMEYSRLKEQILQDIHEGKIERMPNGKPNGYSNAKYAFVEKVSMEAKLEFKDRYRVQ